MVKRQDVAVTSFDHEEGKLPASPLHLREKDIYGLATMPNLLSGTVYAPALQVVTHPVEPDIAKEAELLRSPTCIKVTQ